MLAIPAISQETVIVFDTAGNHTLVVPENVTQMTVETWGAGGHGGRAASNNTNRGGGGGGAYARSVILTVPGESLSIRVGAGASGNSGAAGGDSWIQRGPSQLVMAKGGSSTTGNGGANGGAGGSSIGEVTFSGGNGASRSNSGGVRRGGGGGSSAGPSSGGNPGGNDNAPNGGAAVSGGGAGGSGRTGGGSGAGFAGSAPGGGGGGAVRTGSTSFDGGVGARGLVILRFTPDEEVPPEPDPDPDPPPPEPDPEPEPEPPPAGEVSIAQAPLFLSASVNPQVMLNLSNDHQLYFAAYDDYSDLTGDGLPDITYVHDFDYYGYFDAYKCYTYSTSSNRFVPARETEDKYCSGEWSGNFLNWVAMARIDTVRKILYGGFRSTDSATTTVLERTHLPTDGHSWAKYYNGNDLDRLTPFSIVTGLDIQESGITFCNTTSTRDSGTGTILSQDATSPPLIRVARGNYSLWAANERWQCKWREERRGLLGSGQPGSNGNIPSISGIPASPENPSRTTTYTAAPATGPVALGNGLDIGEFVARVEACVDGLEGTERCKRYPNGNLKPVGILQLYGDDDLIDFGLMSGSYGRNKSGGVLRKNVSSFRNEVNTTTDGTFKAQPASGGIVGTLDRFRIYGYRHTNNGTYFGTTGSDSCSWGLSSFTDGNCSNWGNPQAELFLESLRYFGGHSPNPAFEVNDSGRISGLVTSGWDDPLSNDNFCAPLNIIQFNASTTSYDGNQLDRSVDIGLSNAKQATNAIGEGEGIHGNQWFVGTTPTNTNQLCTPKTISALGEVTGTCPDAPRLDGTFNIAGLAHHAWTNGVRSDLRGEQTVRTFGVELAPAVPTALIPVPGMGRVVTLLPACRNTSLSPAGNCAIVDFQIVEQDFEKGTGLLYVNWEDSEQGGDFDSDMWGVIEYAFEGNVLSVTTRVVAQSTPNRMGFGYVISGTTNGDGFRVHSGNEGFTYSDPDGFPDCSQSGGCRAGDPATTAQYIVGGSATGAGLLERPLYYAAKWGGFDKSDGDTTPARQELWDTTGDGIPDNFVLAINPATLEKALDEAFLSVLVTTASAASVATNSTRLDADAAIYQARFNSERWSGEMLAFGITPGGQVEPEPIWNAATKLDARPPGLRRIFSSRELPVPTSANPMAITNKGIPFEFAALDATQVNQLQEGLSATEIMDDDLDLHRLEFLRGVRSKERTPQNQALPFRRRDSVLGDIVNSNPQFVGVQNFGYGVLGPNDAFPADVGTDYTSFLSDNVGRVPLVVVGSNAGMLHAFDARVDADSVANGLGGREVFAYVPAGIYENLYQLTLPDYVHRYYVDGTPRVSDAWLGTTKGWRKVVAGTTGAGGRSVFMLDVSDPTNFAATDVLWEFRHHRLGVTVGQPSIVALPTGKFGVIVSSGYNNGGTGRVFVLDAETGSVIHVFDTGEATAGMGTPLVLDTTGNTIANRIYVGDLEGRLWRFDLTPSNQNDTRNWGAPNFLTDRVMGNDIVRPLAIVRGPNGEVQPISAQPEGGRNKDGNIMLFFGTGTFFLNGDNVVGSNPDVQTFYGIVDRGVRVRGRGGFTEQNILIEVREFDRELRVVSDTEVVGADGWFLDLIWKQDRGGPGAVGERVTQRAILRGGRIIFTTLIPSPNACDFGGSSWLMELDAFTGARIERPVFDLDGDGLFDDSDMITVIIDGEEVRVAPSGQLPDGVGLLSQPAILSAGDREFKFLSGSTGQIESVTERGSFSFGRHSWRELR
ncbi:MAG: hypothetical protein JJT88_03190 [Gammaproteobacteria bacterium]|nr:hypothetical protein [Gammaproteobacteria bacterium]